MGPAYGKRFSYKLPIFFRDSNMGMVWEAYHKQVPCPWGSLESPLKFWGDETCTMVMVMLVGKSERFRRLRRLLMMMMMMVAMVSGDSDETSRSFGSTTCWKKSGDEAAMGFSRVCHGLR